MTINRTDTLLKAIAEMISSGNVCGYYPYWELSFGDYYRSWHLREESTDFIAQAVLAGNTNGVVSEIIDGEKVQINWTITIQKSE